MMISPEVFYAECRSPEMGFRPFCVLQDCDTADSVVKSNYTESGRCLFMTDAQQREAARQFYDKWNGKGREGEDNVSSISNADMCVT